MMTESIHRDDLRYKERRVVLVTWHDNEVSTFYGSVTGSNWMYEDEYEEILTQKGLFMRMEKPDCEIWHDDDEIIVANVYKDDDLGDLMHL